MIIAEVGLNTCCDMDKTIKTIDEVKKE